MKVGKSRTNTSIKRPGHVWKLQTLKPTARLYLPCTIYSNIRTITKQFSTVQVEVSKIYLYEFPSMLNSDILMHPLDYINPLNPKLNPICYLLALLAHHFLHVSRIRVKSLTLGLLMSYIYGAPILDVSRSHTTTHHSR